VDRLKWFVVRIGSGKTPKGGAEVYEDSGVVFLRSQNVHFDGLHLDDVAYIAPEVDAEMAGTRVHPADVLLNITGASLGRCCIVPDGFPAANVNQHVCIVRPNRRQIAPRFLAYMLGSDLVQSQIFSNENGVSREGLNFFQIADLQVVVPEALSEQEAIVAFLDRETARIDAMIARKERLIALLEEKQAALISHAVTKGLNPNAPMKDSGIDWLGPIPAHWQAKPLMRMTPDDRPIMYGIVLPGPNVEEGVPIVKGGDVGPGRLRLQLLNRTTREIEQGYVRSRLLSGDIVYAIRGSIGTAEMVPAELVGANLTQDAARVSPRRDIHGPWLLYAVKSAAFFAQLDAKATGATIRGINIRDLKRGVVPVPPRPEQETIAAYLDSVTVKMSTIVAKCRESVQRLQEHRRALISAAVMGKIDVRISVGVETLSAMGECAVPAVGGGDGRVRDADAPQASRFIGKR